jgi:hypothetical protein
MAAYGDMDSAMLGLLYGFDNDVESYPCSADVTPGRPLYQTPGTPTTVKSTYASGDVFVGVALASQRANIADVGLYAKYEVVNVLTRGKVWVQVAAAVSTAPVAAYANSAGLFSITASGNYNGGCMFRTNQATVSGLAVLEVNGPKLVA